MLFLLLHEYPDLFSKVINGFVEFFIDSCSSITEMVVCSEPKLSSRQNSKMPVTFFTLNSNLFFVTFFFVRTPEQGSIRPTYSFVHMALTMSIAEKAATTPSRPVRAAQIQRGLYAGKAWTIGCKSRPVSERDFFLFLLRPGRAGGTVW